MVGFPNNHGTVFLLKMIILGCEMGVPRFKETPIYQMVGAALSWRKPCLSASKLGRSKKVNSVHTILVAWPTMVMPDEQPV